MSDELESQVAEKLTRFSVPELDDILGISFPLLNGEGFVRAVDYMGCDKSIVQAARVSYGEGTKKLSEDRGLIRYLLRHRHTTPLEMCEIKLHVRCPMDLWRQWIRHRTASVNEYSTRYSVAIDACAKTPADKWRLQSVTNKQGSGGTVTEWPKDYVHGTHPPASPGDYLTQREEELQTLAREVYEERVGPFAVAREQARKDLPLSTMTEAYWKCDLHNLFHFLSLRMESHAQQEVREYANCIGNEIVAKWCPLAWEAFKDYRFNATNLSRLEIEVLGFMTTGQWQEAEAKAREFGWLEIDEKATDADGKKVYKKNRERDEFETKAIGLLNIVPPWSDYGPLPKKG